MKKFLAIALFLVLAVSLFAVASTAAETATYWSISSDCLVKARVLDDGTVPTFKQVDSEGLLVGLPTDAVLGDDYFQAKDGYTIKYLDKNNNEITSSAEHIGTTDKVAVYSGSTLVDSYGIVTYGDADGDGVFDVIDAAIAAIYLNDNTSDDEYSAAVFEAVKPREGVDNTYIEAEDYQQIVNDSVKDESELTENLKGRKTPIDETLSFESIIYANTGATRAASVTANDSTFKSLVTINYNGSSTAPSASGIYSVTAYVPESETYLVTPGERELGFIVIAPKASTGYSVVADNTNKKITVNISNFYTSDATFDSYISGWYNSAYNLTMAGSAVTSGDGAVSALSPRTVTKYTHSSSNITMADATDLLGCYLPDDYTLWNDENANKTVSVALDNGTDFGFTFVIQQDADAIRVLQENYLLTISSAARGQRYEDPAETTGGSGWLDFSTKGVFVSAERLLNSETSQLENSISVILGNGRFYPGMTTAFDGTGLKTVLVGYTDSLMFTSAASKAELGDITSGATLLYNTSSNNRRYSNYSGTEIVTDSSTFMGIINSVLGGMNIELSITSSTEELRDEQGWCRYACAGSSNGLRYTIDYFLRFDDLNTSEDDHHSINVVAVDGCTITTTPTQTQTYNEKDDDGNVIATYYHKDSLTNGEPFRVSATLADGYKLSVKDASGNDVYYEAEHNWYIMPNSDVTITAVAE